MTTHPATLGRFFEGFVVGDVYQHPLGRTITEADNTWLTLLSMNTNQNHFNAHLAGQNPLTQGRVIVDPGLRIAVVLGVSVLDMSQNAIANLEMADVRLTHPLYAGDTLYAESVCTALRPSASRPYAGIVSMTTRPESGRRRDHLLPPFGHAGHARERDRPGLLPGSQDGAAGGRPGSAGGRQMKPLRDIRVISLEQYGAGPFGSVHLADLGAEIIEIEDPGWAPVVRGRVGLAGGRRPLTARREPAAVAVRAATAATSPGASRCRGRG